MSKARHTQGPWKIERTASSVSFERQTVSHDDSSRRIIEPVMILSDNGVLLPNPANAALIAAAPEMLDALEFARDLLLQCQTMLRQSSEANHCLETVISAINKAKGSV
jgi:hypothetical protein